MCLRRRKDIIHVVRAFLQSPRDLEDVQHIIPYQPSNLTMHPQSRILSLSFLLKHVKSFLLAEATQNDDSAKPDIWRGTATGVDRHTS